MSNLPRAPLRQDQALTRNLDQACTLAKLLQQYDHFPCKEGDSRFAVTFMNGDFQLLGKGNDCARYNLRATVKVKAFNSPTQAFESRNNLLLRVSPQCACAPAIVRTDLCLFSLDLDH